MGKDSAAGAAQERFDRIGEQAADSLRGDARRVHDLAEQFREQYRRDLEEWMQLRARLDRRGGALRPLGTDALRAEYEQRGRELASLQAQLKRLDVVAKQLDLLFGYLESAEAARRRAGADGRRVARHHEPAHRPGPGGRSGSAWPRTSTTVRRRS